MRRLLLISLVTIPLAGCQFFGGDGDESVVDLIETIEEDDSLASVPTVPSVPNVGAETPEEGEGEEAEDATAGSSSTALASTDLIRSTDPDARTRQVNRTRVDPFASLVIPPAPEVPEVIPVVNTGGSDTTGANAAANARANTPTPPPVTVQPNNAPLVIPSPIAALPSIPQPVIAPTVSVSGVVQLGNEPYAIVRLGSEPERYVRVGDLIAGGAVRVKRIETLAFEPRVILEENGIEVARPVSQGSEAAPAEAPGAGEEATAASPRALPSMASAGGQGTLPTASVANPLPVAPAASVVPTGGLRLPDSLLLPTAASPQAVLPNLQVPVPGV